MLSRDWKWMLYLSSWGKTYSSHAKELDNKVHSYLKFKEGGEIPFLDAFYFRLSGRNLYYTATKSDTFSTERSVACHTSRGFHTFFRDD